MLVALLLSAPGFAQAAAGGTTIVEAGLRGTAGGGETGLAVDLQARTSLGRIGIRSTVSLGTVTVPIAAEINEFARPLTMDVGHIELGVGPRWTYGRVSEAFPHLVIRLENQAFGRRMWFAMIDANTLGSPSVVSLRLGLEHLSVVSLGNSPFALQASVGVGALRRTALATFVSRRRAQAVNFEPYYNEPQVGLAVSATGGLSLMLVASDAFQVSAGAEADVSRWTIPVLGDEGPYWQVQGGPRADARFLF